MKKNAVILAVAVFTVIFSTQLSAQDQPVSVGIKAGTNLSNYRLGGGMNSSTSRMGIGGTFGGVIKYELSKNFALQSGADVYYRTSQSGSSSDNAGGKFISIGVEIPLYGIVQGAIGSGRAFIGAGPYVGYGISAKSQGVSLFKNDRETGRPAMNRFDYGAGGIIGYDFDENWQINASYQFGMAVLLKSKGGDMKSQSASIGIAFKF